MFDLWKKRALYLIKKGQDRNEIMFQLFEKIVLFKAATKGSPAGQKQSVEVDLVIADMAEFLNAEGYKDIAMRYLEKSANGKQSNVAFAKDRIFKSDSTHALASQFARPQFPY